MLVEEILASVGGRVVRRFGERTDSRSEIIGIEHEDGRFVVKASTDPDGVGWLRGAIAVHGRVTHPAIVPLLRSFDLEGGGLALVYPWAPGEVLGDLYDPGVPAMESASSPYRRFRALPVDTLLPALREIVDAHVAVAAAGLVAVDLYQGCVIVDFEDDGRVHLIDLDHYRPGPYVLEHDRQLGSTTYMAPEEFQRGATIDERTTVFTLARFGLVFLGCARHQPAERSAFRGGDALWDVLVRATDPSPSARFETVSALAAAWDEAVGVA